MTITGAAAFEFANLRPTASDALRLDVLLLARPGSPNVTLVHSGGTPLDPQALRALVLVNGSVSYDGVAGPAGRWSVGDTLRVGPLAAPLAPNARVEITITERLVGKVLTQAGTTAQALKPPTAATAPGFAISLSLAGGSNPVILEPPAGLLVEADVSHPEGRKFVRFVYANFSGFDGIDWQELRDDGTNGDRRTGDGIYTAITLVPVNTTSGRANVTATAVDFNGTQATTTASVTLLARSEVTEQFSNPTGSPAPGGASCPAGNAAVRQVQYQLNNATLVPSLAGFVRQGDHVKVVVTLADGCASAGVQLGLVSYMATSPQFSFTTAAGSALYQSATVTPTVNQTALEIDVPACYFAVDLVRGSVLATLGPSASNGYYSRQGRLLDSDNGGTTPCS